MAIQAYNLGDAGGTLILPQGLSPNAIAAGTYNNKLITSFDKEMFARVRTTQDAVDRHPKKHNFVDLLKYLGFMMPIAPGNDRTYGHWEKDWQKQSLIIDSNGFTGTGGDGADVKFKLDTDQIHSYLGRPYCYAQKRDILTIQLSPTQIVNVWVKDIQVSGPTFELTVTPDDSDLDLLAALGGGGAGAGMELAITSTAYQEGSRQGRGRQSRVIKYSNQMQIIKQDDEVTGSFLTSSFDIKSVPLEGGRVAFEVAGMQEARDRFKNDREGAILVGTRNDNYKETDTTNALPELIGGDVYSTQGMLPFINQNGHNMPFLNGSNISIDDFDAINDILEAEAAPDNYIVAHGSGYGYQIREALKDYLEGDVSNLYASSQPLFGGAGITPDIAAALAVQVQFKSLNLMGWGNRTFHFKSISSFDDPKSLGASSYTFKDQAYFLPHGTVENVMPTAQQSSIFGNLFDATRVPYFGYVYAQKGGYNREVESFFTGSAGELVTRPTDDADVKRFHMRGEFGASMAAGNLFLAHYPSSGNGSVGS